MPVQVRCGQCEHTINAPDQARGKAIRCPKCKGPVRVPGGKKGTKKKKKKPQQARLDPDADGFLAGVDLDRLEDQEARVCPKCGADIYGEAFECEKCGTDIRTGKLSLRVQKERSRRGPDPSQFYSDVWGDAWQFVMRHKILGVRTSIYMVIATAITWGTAYMAMWCRNIPPKAFWGMISTVATFITPGWVWFLYVETTKATLARKDTLSRVNFDLFLNVALGIKVILWSAVVQLPFQLVTGGIGALLLNMDQTIAAAVCFAIAPIICLPMFPIAMGHMAMPVTWKGWISPLMIKPLGRTLGPALFWCVVMLAVNLPAIGGTATLGALYGKKMNLFMSQVRRNAEIRRIETVDEEEDPDIGDHPLFGEREIEVDWSIWTVPAVIAGCVAVYSGFAVIFSVRTVGLFVMYFKRHLDLVTLIKEKKYVVKDPLAGEKPKNKKVERAKQVGAILGALLALYVVANVISYYATGGDTLLMPRKMAVWMGIVDS